MALGLRRKEGFVSLVSRLEMRCLEARDTADSFSSLRESCPSVVVLPTDSASSSALEDGSNSRLEATSFDSSDSASFLGLSSLSAFNSSEASFSFYS